jgi:hypothetical protein
MTLEERMMWAAFLASSPILLLIFIFYCGKICAIGWYRGKQLFERKFPNNRRDRE